jgi:intein/homing endonuclease/RecA/RadA recombinase
MVKKKEKEERVGNYFLKEKELKFISSGCQILDCVLGGGWPLGRISNVIGDASSNKCIKDSYILIKDKGMVKIDSLGLNFEKGYSNFVENLIIDEKRKDTTSHFYKENTDKTFKIKTKHGYEIEGTDIHPIIILNENGEHEFKKLKDIKVGEFAIISKNTNVFSNKKFKINFDSSKYAQNRKEVSIPKELDESLASLLGLYVADGGFHGNSIRISNTKKWFYKEVDSCLEKLNLTRCGGKSEDTISSVVLVDLLKYLLSVKDNRFTARYKYIPDCILQSPKEVQVSFLRSLFDCDGRIDEGSINLYTASEKLAKQVHLMLLNLGIISSLRRNDGSKIGEKYYDNTYCVISAYALDYETYKNIIGSNRFSFSNLKKQRRSGYDSIPYIFSRIKNDISSIKESNGWSKNGVLKNGGRLPKFQVNIKGDKISKGALQKFISKFKDFGIDSEYYNSFNSYHIDEIVSKKEINEQTLVYDVCIPESHTFWANGFINHNTGLSVEAIANFRKQFKDGYIWYQDAEAAFDVDYARTLGLPSDDKTFIIDDVVDITETYNLMLEAVKQVEQDKVPGIYVIDTLDALVPVAKDELSEGYDAAKRAALVNSLITSIHSKVDQANIHLMVVSQIRENLGVMIGNKYRVAGGKALGFYASQRLFLVEKGKLTKTIRGIKRPYGIETIAKCKKNKVGLPFRECELPVIFNYGVDDVTANLNFLAGVKGALEEIGIEEGALKEIKENCTKEMKDKIDAQVKKIWDETEVSFLPNKVKYEYSE